MAASTGPILALTGVTLANESIVQGKPVDLRVLAAGCLAAGGFALAERVLPDVIPPLAWLAFITTLLVRIQPDKPAPVESLLAWWQHGSPAAVTAPKAGPGGVVPHSPNIA